MAEEATPLCCLPQARAASGTDASRFRGKTVKIQTSGARPRGPSSVNPGRLVAGSRGLDCRQAPRDSGGVWEPWADGRARAATARPRPGQRRLAGPRAPSRCRQWLSGTWRWLRDKTNVSSSAWSTQEGKGRSRDAPQATNSTKEENHGMFLFLAFLSTVSGEMLVKLFIFSLERVDSRL